MGNNEQSEKIVARGAALPPLTRKNTSEQSAGFYRMMLGDHEMTVLLDGTDPFPLEKLLIDSKPHECIAPCNNPAWRPPSRRRSTPS